MQVRLKVREVAQAKGISQGLLGRIANVDPKTMRRIYQRPHEQWTSTILARIADALDVSMCELFEELPDDAPDI